MLRALVVLFLCLVGGAVSADWSTSFETAGERDLWYRSGTSFTTAYPRTGSYSLFFNGDGEYAELDVSYPSEGAIRFWYGANIPAQERMRVYANGVLLASVQDYGSGIYNVHTVTIPAGTTLLRFQVHWVTGSNNCRIEDLELLGGDQGSPVPDQDLDGIPDDTDWDIDGDGLANVAGAIGHDGDAQPLVPIVDSDGDGVPDSEDDWPTEDWRYRLGTSTVDTDGDGTYDAFDDDDDGDGVRDELDHFPTIDTEWTHADDSRDGDADGTPDGIDTDDDNDGIHDDADPTPLGDSATGSGGDIDGDGIPDDTDEDKDGDGLHNDEDPAPEVAMVDSDGDGVADADDEFPSDVDFYVDETSATDTDGDGTPDATDDDDDGDGVADAFDEVPVIGYRLGQLAYVASGGHGRGWHARLVGRRRRRRRDARCSR